MSYFGTTKIGKMYLGSTEIAKAYLGDDLVFQNGGTPPIAPVFYDRLVFDGTAYIDTDIIPAADCSFRCVFGNETVKSAQRVFSQPCANSAQSGIVLNSNTNSTKRVFSAYYGSTSSLSANKEVNFSNAEYSFFMTPNSFGWGTGNNPITKGSNAPSSGLILGSSPTHNGNPFTGTMSIFRIYGSDAQNCTSYSDFTNYTPVYTIKPCTYNGVAGLWCEETSTFYGNTAGSGTLSVRNNS